MVRGVRILYFLSESYPTFRVDVDKLFGKFLFLNGICSDLLTLKNEEVQFKDWGAGKVFLIKKGRLNNFIKFIYACYFLMRVNKYHYDAIQVRDMPILGFFLLMICRIRGMKFFYWSSYPISLGQILRAKRLRVLDFGKVLLLLRGYLGLMLLRIVIRNSDHIFAQSEKMKSDFVRDGGDGNKITPVPMGVDFESMGRYSTRVRRSDCIAYLGTIDPQRKVDVIIEAFFLAKKKLPDIKLVIIGDTVYEDHKKKLISLIDGLQLSDFVEITGWLGMEDAWERLSECKIGVSLFPRGELLDSASPTKVPEYLAIGLPVVCNDNPDQAEILRASGAGFCVPSDSESLSEAIVRLLTVPADDFDNMVRSGKSYVESFRDYSVISRNLAEKYRELCDG